MKDLDRSFLGHPKVLFSLSMVEIWERFSYYGIRPLLILFMSLSIFEGGFGMSTQQASSVVGVFAGMIYIFTIPGGYLADNFLGQKKAVLLGSLFISFGHLCIALSYYIKPMFFAGLCFIVIGSGLFKTCISVMVGMLYLKNDIRRDSAFTIFYSGINIGAFFAPLIVGIVLDNYGYHLGFAVGGVAMLIALVIFYFISMKHYDEFIKYKNLDDYDKCKVSNKSICFYMFLTIIIVFAFIILIHFKIINFSIVSVSVNLVRIILLFSTLYFLYLFFFKNLNKDEKKNLLLFVILFFAAALFWSIFEQMATTLNLFADKLINKKIFSYEIPTLFFQSLDPLYIIIFAPLMSLLWIKLNKHNINISSLSKFALGLIGAAVGFYIMYLAAANIVENNVKVSYWYLVISILFLALGELCLSPVGLSIMSKIAPKSIKSQVMGLWFVASSLGNVIAGYIGGKVDTNNVSDLPNLFLYCVYVLLFVAFILFIIKRFVKENE